MPTFDVYPVMGRAGMLVRFASASGRFTVHDPTTGDPVPVTQGGVSVAQVVAGADGRLLFDTASLDTVRLRDVSAPTLGVVVRALGYGSSGGPGGAVSSVNGKTGTVVLSAPDVGAAATSHTHAISDLTATGAKDASTFLRGDGAWAVPPSGGGGSSTGYSRVSAQTGTAYSAVAADAGALVTLNNSSGITVTLPTDAGQSVSVGGVIDFAVLGVGMATFQAASGATVSGTPSLVTRARYSAVSAVKTAANSWLLIGDLA